MFDFVIAGIHAPIFLLVLTGFTVGIVGGFIGVGGGYMVTPALIVFGFPGYMASGIDATHIAGKAVISSIRHRQLGNIDWTLALTMVGGTMLGVELGVRLLNYTKKLGIAGVVLLACSVVVMFFLFLYTQLETRRAHKKIEEAAEAGRTVGRELKTSTLHHFFQRIPLYPIVRCRTARVVVSMWVVVLIGIATGLLAGFLGRWGWIHPGTISRVSHRRHHAHFGRDRSRRDRGLGRLRRAPAVHVRKRGHDGRALHDRRSHDRRPVRVDRNSLCAGARDPLHPELLPDSGHDRSLSAAHLRPDRAKN
jgi:uncharacterized membrane protein YfcA